MKRALDVVLSLAALVALSPALVGISVLVALTMGRPVIFRQTRPGLGEKAFDLLKFRTMTDARGPDGDLLPDRDRLTRLGRLLRATSLDELPELLNVLRGEMSLVGPRPLLPRYLPYYTERERLRHSVRPGITGWAQIRGRNEARWEDRLAHDVWYVEHRSLWLDLAIIARTVLVVFRRSGVVVDPESMMRNLDDERRERANRVEDDGNEPARQLQHQTGQG